MPLNVVRKALHIKASKITAFSEYMKVFFEKKSTNVLFHSFGTIFAQENKKTNNGKT